MAFPRVKASAAARGYGRDHQSRVKAAKDELTRAGVGLCAEKICKKRSRVIYPGMDLHLCHDRRTGQVLGLGHAACNMSEAGRYARSLQSPLPRW